MNRQKTKMLPLQGKFVVEAEGGCADGVPLIPTPKLSIDIQQQ